MLIKFFADVRKFTGRLEQEWTRPAPTLRELVLGLAEQHGQAFLDRVLPGGKLSATIIVLVNGQSIVHLEGLETALGPEDTVAFFPMIAGG
jgi:molybdopterin synthase sulfur carrier subunit